jgi:multidrug efflux pump subunit AcrA (membrane-fusion protein)
MAGCSTPTPTPAATQTAQEAEQSSVVSATGEVVPAQYATLSLPISGQIVELNVKEGDTIQQGDLIVQLDTTDFDTAIVRAEAAVSVAKANLALAKAGPRDQEVQRAKDQLAAANARISVATARKDQLLAPPDENSVINAQAEIEQARQALEDAQEAYDQIIGSINSWDEDLRPGDRTPLDAEQNARYALELARLQLEAAIAALEDLLDGPTPEAIRLADARIAVASAQRNAAKAYLDLVSAGPLSTDIAISEAQVEEARAALESAQAAREQAFLKAPFDGVVSELYVDANEYLSAGQQVLLLANLSTLRVETTDLNEIDVARISAGDSVSVTFDALPDITLEGTVASIGPKAEEGAGVNYTVVIDLADLPPELRWGMTAFVDIPVQ